MSAAVERGSAPKIGTPRELFNTGLILDPAINQYAVTAGGRKFLVLEPRKGFNETYSVVLNLVRDSEVARRSHRLLWLRKKHRQP